MSEEMSSTSELGRTVVALLRAAGRVRGRAAARLEPFDLTPQQYNVLRILRGAYPHPLPTLEVGSRMIEQCPGVTRLLDRLEEKGLVHRERGDDDRRLVHCSLTPAGLDALSEADAAIRGGNEQALGHMTAAERLALIALLERIAPPGS